METEKLKVKLGISGTYWEKVPEIRVSFNDQVVFHGDMTVPTGEVQFLEFDVENSTEQGVLRVELLNKVPDQDTVKSNYDSQDYTIVKDLLVGIEHLEVDDIDLSSLVYTQSQYRPVYPANYITDHKPEVITGCKTLGWNGTWSMTWGNPFYIWLLESL